MKKSIAEIHIDQLIEEHSAYTGQMAPLSAAALEIAEFAGKRRDLRLVELTGQLATSVMAIEQYMDQRCREAARLINETRDAIAKEAIEKQKKGQASESSS